jgi:hypothetical protein
MPGWPTLRQSRPPWHRPPCHSPTVPSSTLLCYPYPGFRVHSLNDLAEVQPLIAAAGFRETEVQQALGTMRFPTPAHMVRRYGALHSLEVTPAVADWPALL